MSHGLFYWCIYYVSEPGNISVVLLSMEGLIALRFHQKYLNLCSEDERRSYEFGTTWGWVINDRIFILGWTNPLKSIFSNYRCWTTNPYIHYTVNIGYYALVFIFTTGIFIMIVTKVVQARNIKAVDGKRKTFRKQLMMVLSLFLLFGLTWSVAFFSYGPMLIPSYYIFTVLNSLQGEKQSHASEHLV